MAFFKKTVEKFNVNEVKINDNPQHNFIDAFKASLPEEDREKDIFELKRNQQYGLIYATILTFYQMVSDPKAIAIKSQSMLASAMVRHDIEKFELSVSFFGSKDQVSAENFLFNIYEVPFGYDPKMGEDEEANANAKQPLEKQSSLMEQKDNVLEVFEQVKHYFKTPSDALFTTCGLIINFDYMSDRNMENHELFLDGPIIQNVLVKKAYMSSFHREEIEHDNNLNQTQLFLKKLFKK